MIFGTNLYVIGAILAGAILLLQITSKEEIVMAILAVVAITYMTR